jgi:hypothetical protein
MPLIRLTCVGWAGMGVGASLAQPPGHSTPPSPGVLAQYRQTQCSLPGTESSTRLVDRAPRPTRAQAPTAEQAGLAGLQAQLQRPVRWAREQVLVHALAQQPSLGISVDALRVLTAPAAARPAESGHLLMLRVQRPEPGTLAAMALSRPCVWVVVPRNPAVAWRVLVLDAATPVGSMSFRVERDRPG